jgi:hypothetical protein
VARPLACTMRSRLIIALRGQEKRGLDFLKRENGINLAAANFCSGLVKAAHALMLVVASTRHA